MKKLCFLNKHFITLYIDKNKHNVEIYNLLTQELNKNLFDNIKLILNKMHIKTSMQLKINKKYFYKIIILISNNNIKFTKKNYNIC